MRFYLLVLISLSIMSSLWAKPMNIVFLLADDQRFDFLGCTGHPILKTPHIDKLADEGTIFNNMTVTTSTCWISRASILTGMRIEGHRYAYKGRGPLASKWADLSFSTRLEVP